MFYNVDSKGDNIKKVRSYGKLGRNWNGNDAEPYENDFINYVIDIIKELKYQPKIFPTACNSIQFEYYLKNSDDKYLEIEIFDDRAEIYIEHPKCNREYLIPYPTATKINEVVDEFYALDNC